MRTNEEVNIRWISDARKAYDNTLVIDSVALSSAEAESNALVKMISESLGLKNVQKAMGLHLPIEVLTDSSACKGIVHREGCGKVKHLEARQLWVQEYVGDKTVKVSKIPREVNLSDVLTHHWNARDGY